MSEAKEEKFDRREYQKIYQKQYYYRKMLERLEKEAELAKQGLLEPKKENRGRPRKYPTMEAYRQANHEKAKERYRLIREKKMFKNMLTWLEENALEVLFCEENNGILLKLKPEDWERFLKP